MKYASIIVALMLIFSNVNAKESNSTKSTPTFSLKTANKGTIEVKEVENGIAFQNFEEKVTVLTFIAYNGRPCLNLISILNEMKKGVVKFVQLGVIPKEGFEKIYQKIK